MLLFVCACVRHKIKNLNILWFANVNFRHEGVIKIIVLDILTNIFFSMKKKSWNLHFGKKKVGFSILIFCFSKFVIVYRFWDFLENVRDFQILRFVSNISRFFRFSDFQICLKMFEIFIFQICSQDVSDFLIFYNFQIFVPKN